MEKFHDVPAKKEDAHHSLLSDAYDFGAQLLKSANHAIHDHSNMTLAIGVVGVVATHGKGAGALADDLIAAEGKNLLKAGTTGEAAAATRTGAQELLSALGAAETPEEASLALLRHGNFERSYAGYRRFFGP